VFTAVQFFNFLPTIEKYNSLIINSVGLVYKFL